MNDDDIPSVTESEPVSDVNPDEMARLMADIDDIDDNLFKSGTKIAGSYTTPAKTPDKKTVKFEEKIKGKPKENDDDDDDDWDADDLLHSDDETVPTRTEDSQKQQAARDSGNLKNENIKENKSVSPDRGQTKDMLMKDLFSDSQASPPKETSLSQETRRTKKKELLDDLFSSPSKSPATNTVPVRGSALSPSTVSAKAQTSKGDSKLLKSRKAKDEISFDDDEDLFKSLSDGPKKPPQKSETEGKKGGGKGSFLDSILTSSAQTESSSVQKSKAFVLDEKYKKGRGNEKDDLGFGGYAPSARKVDSPRRRPLRKPVAKDEFVLFDSDMPRKPSSVGKPFDIDDDDILGNIKVKKSSKGSGELQRKQETEGNKIETTPLKPAPEAESSKDWLTPGTGEAKQSSSSKTRSAGTAGEEDWLGLSLAATKRQAQSSSKEVINASGLRSSKTISQQPVPEASPYGTPTETAAPHPSSPAAAPPSHPSTPAIVPSSHHSTPAMAPLSHQSTPAPSYHTTPSLPSGFQSSMPTVLPAQVHNVQTTSAGLHGGSGASASQMVSADVSGSSSNQIVPAQGSGFVDVVGYTRTPEFQQSLQLQDLLRQQQEAQMQAAAFAQQLRNQQGQIQEEMKERLQRQLQQQQQQFQLQQQEYQTMLEILQRQQSEAAIKQHEIMPHFHSSSPKSPVSPTADEQHVKELQAELQDSQLEVERLEAHIKLLNTQHEEQLQLVEEVHRKKQQLAQELWEQSEARLRQDRDKLDTECRNKLKEAQVEKESLIATHEDQMKQLKVQWTAAVESVKEVYTNVIERMKAEHNTSIERLTELKNIEVKALLSAQGHSKDIEVVMTQLEGNTENLTGLSFIVNQKHENALELSKRALEMKERQLKEFEANVLAARAEAENERARLNALVDRLEHRLISQGSEVEQDRWKVAQERIQLETERAAIKEERKHMRISLEVERRELVAARETMSAEHRQMMAAVARDKQEVARQQARLDALTHMSPLDVTVLSGQRTSDEAELAVVAEERDRLKMRQMQLQERAAQLDQQRRQLEERENELKDTKTKLDQERESFLREKRIIEHMRDSSNKSQQETKMLIDQQEAKIQEMKAKAANIQAQQLELEQLRIALQQYVQEGLCTRCKTAGISDESGFAYVRLPADGGENVPSSMEHTLAPTTVLARLAEARKHELDHKLKRKVQIVNLNKEAR